jgi:hypothetical protein
VENHAIRLLKANEIECRVSIVKENGVSLLLYKDARVDQRILDETFGLFGWKRSHQCIDGNLYCTVEVYDKETGEWVAKQDVGTMGYAEKEKSQASDSFKRACFNWGIGRELYTAPFIWIPAASVTIKKNGDKLYCSDHFSVRSITYNRDREIAGLVITNDSNQGQVVYEMGAKAEKPKGNTDARNGDKQQSKGSASNGSALSKTQLQSLEKELQRTGVGMEVVQERYKIENPSAISGDLYGKIMAALAKTKSKAA